MALWAAKLTTPTPTSTPFRCAVTCSSDLSIKIWDTNNEWKTVKTLFGHDHTISSARWMPNDDFVVSAGRDRTIRVWEVASG